MLGFTGSMARSWTLGPVSPVGLHAIPPVMDLKTAELPAYTLSVFVGSMASAPTNGLVRPPFMGVHMAPPVVVLKTPPLMVPAYIVSERIGSMTSSRTLVFVSPMFMGSHVSPLVLVLRTPQLVPAYRVLGFVASMARADTLTAESSVLIELQD